MRQKRHMVLEEMRQSWRLWKFSPLAWRDLGLGDGSGSRDHIARCCRSAGARVRSPAAVCPRGPAPRPAAGASLPPTHAGLARSGLAENPVYRGTADRAGALGHLHSGFRDGYLAFEVALLLALDAV